MALFTVKTSKKIDTSMKLEESTAKMLDRYAHFHKATAEDVVNESLEYVFKHDKDFQAYLQQNPNEAIAATVRVRKSPTPSKDTKPSANGNGNHSQNGTAARTASAATPSARE